MFKLPDCFTIIICMFGITGAVLHVGMNIANRDYVGILFDLGAKALFLFIITHVMQDKRILWSKKNDSRE